jgi:hypothetical protein
MAVESIAYRAFLDFAGGSGGDSSTLAIAHADTRDGQPIAVLDCVRERRPPFSPDDVVREFAATLRAYGVAHVISDRWGGGFPIDAMRKFGIAVEASAGAKSEQYAEVLPLLNSRRIELLDNPRLVGQLAALERRTSSGGRDAIDHPAHAHDDLINAAAGALLLASSVGRPTVRLRRLVGF